MKLKPNYLLCALMIVMSLCVTGFRSSSWCVGKWEGKTNNSAEYFTITINPDGTCKVHQDWRGLDRWYEDFDAKWEKVSDDIIKIYDYDGHMHINIDSRRRENTYRVARWSMHLRKDGSFAQKVENLNRPTARLTKK